MYLKKYLIPLLLFIILLSAISAVFIFSQDTRDIILGKEDGEKEYKAERVALIIGVEEYLYHPTIKNLKYSVDDAQIMKEVLSKYGVFSVNYLSDDSPLKPTKKNIIDSLKEVNNMAKMGMLKTFVFYFAGHGFNVDGSNYLAPTEINPADIKGTGVKLDDVLKLIKEIKSNAKAMVFIDACRNDPSSRGGGGTFTDIDSKGLKILYSTSKGQYSYEIEEKKHGVYTYYLEEALNGKADKKPYGNADSYISFNEASKYVYYKMMEWSNQNPDYKQLPRIEMQEAIGDFFLTYIGDKKEEDKENPEDDKSDDNDDNVVEDRDAPDNEDYIYAWDDDVKQYREQRLAVVIGSSFNYKEENAEGAEFAVSNSYHMRDVLTEIGVFDVRLINDDTEIKPTKKNIIYYLNEINNYIVEEEKVETLLLYFSGRGFIYEDMEYFVPADAEKFDALGSSISMSEIMYSLRDALDICSCVFIFDISREFMEDANGVPQIEEPVDDYIDELAIFFPTHPGGYSHNLEEYEMTMFTYYLTEGLWGDADLMAQISDKNGMVSVLELTDYLFIKIDNMSHKMDMPMNPEIILFNEEDISYLNLTSVRDYD